MVCVDTPESRTQVYIYDDGVLKVHDSVTFEANAASGDSKGGAVSLPSEIGYCVPVVLICDAFAGVGSIL